MSEETATAGPLPAVPYLKIPADGEPYLEGHRCQSCGAMFLGERSVCSKCGTRDQMEATRLSNDGSLYVYSIVHRSFPGIDTPYVSAIVDLEGGGTVKGNLIGIDPDPEKIALGMPVRVVYKDALGRKDREGNSYLSYFFEPRG
ncbi:MAG: Zn-ribbon domain-containing OB-fold protein [Myxococcota bacterium]|nr:Zn-ribbon domain-containing OB-fold protein [Myxococcota bacterium]